jgi:hypothetical protein
MPLINIKNISDHLNKQINGIIGMNIIKKYDLMLSKHQVTFYNKNELIFNNPIEVFTKNDIPYIKTYFTGNLNILKFYFDTGSTFNYVNDYLVMFKKGVKEEKEDFHQSIGVYKTKVYDFEIDVNSEKLKLKFGVLPDKLKNLLSKTKMDGIISSQLLFHFDILLSISQKKFQLKIL